MRKGSWFTCYSCVNCIVEQNQQNYELATVFIWRLIRVYRDKFQYQADKGWDVVVDLIDCRVCPRPWQTHVGLSGWVIALGSTSGPSHFLLWPSSLALFLNHHEWRNFAFHSDLLPHDAAFNLVRETSDPGERNSEIVRKLNFLSFKLRVSSTVFQ